jgi:uncharacterized low-complexity protein
MKKVVIRALIVGAFALGATAAYAAAQPAPTQQQQQQVEQTPKGWSYNLQNGQRVPKGNRVTNSDGSWREELKQGNCVTVKEKTASGEYKESRQCNQR